MQNEIELRQQQEIINRGRNFGMSRLNGVSCDVRTLFIFLPRLYLHFLYIGKQNTGCQRPV